MSEVVKKSVSVSYVYDPDLDVSPVDQFGFVDLRSAFETHSIPGDLMVDSESYNGVEDPNSLLGSPKDVFEAYRKAEAVKARQSAIAAATAGDPAGAGDPSSAGTE